MAAALLLSAAGASGQQENTLHSFSYSVGQNPEHGVVQGSDGNFYGTTAARGGAGDGTVFRVTASGSLTTLHAFAGPDGSIPNGLVQGSDGYFYGTATYGGTGYGGGGTIFRISASGSFSTIYQFTGGLLSIDTNGAYPTAGLVQGRDGNFYGTTSYGAANSTNGTVFKITPGGQLTTLYSLRYADGGHPGGLVQASDGNFYGTAENGGLGAGTVFQITPGGALTVLHTFSEVDGTGANADGAYPAAGLVQGTNGNLYGTTEGGGANGEGTVFQITLGGSLTTVHAFSATSALYPNTNADGAVPAAALVQGTNGFIYGTASTGGTDGGGTFYQVTASGSFTALHSFYPPVEGSNPDGLIQGSDGNFYGTNAANGSNTNGTVFEITPGGSVTTLTSFAPSNDGADPVAGLIHGSDGNFYGTTSSGGGADAGVVYQLTRGGSCTTLYSFSNGNDGGYPDGALVQGSDGDFYGTASSGGASGDGTVFQVTSSGSFTTLHSFGFILDGANPQSALIEGSDGTFYGTTEGGGGRGYGTVFNISYSGSLTTLHSFGAEYADPDGLQPSALVEGTDGDFYGTTTYGGKNQNGTVFRITPGGSLTTLHAFSELKYKAAELGQVNTDGASPLGTLIQGSDGDFYGTTSAGGSYAGGTVFKMTADGKVTTLHSFNGIADGTFASAGLVEGSKGNFYGTTRYGGSFGYGTVYQITASGSFNTVYAFTGGLDGGNPTSTLILDSSGNLYGTSGAGGSDDNGAVFEIVLSPIVTTSTATGVFGLGATLNGAVNTGGTSAAVYFQYGTDITYGQSTSVQTIAAGSGSQAFSAKLSGLTPETTYHYRAVATNAYGTAYGADQVFNITTVPYYLPPVAVNEQVYTASSTLAPIVINVLADDSDPDGYPLVVSSVTSASVGNVSISGTGTTITYTPRISFAAFGGSDTFSYTISDGHGGTATANVTVSNPFYNIKGTYDGLLTYASGAYGELSLTLADNGAFTGSVAEDGRRFALSGTFGYDGSYSVVIAPQYSGETPVTLTLNLGSGTSANTITGSLSDSTSSYSISAARGLYNATTNPAPYAGKYTVLIPAPPAPSGTQATAYAVVIGGRIHGILLTNGGSGYVTAPVVTISGPTGSGAKAYAILSSGTVSAIVFYALGSHYSPAGTNVTIDPPSDGLPQGTGYATMNVTQGGAITMAGQLGDGTPFSTGAVADEDGTFGFYVPLAKGWGSISGTVTFESIDGVSDCDGELTWINSIPRHNDPYYASGFTTTVNLIGARYVAPRPGVTALNFPTTPGIAALELSDANLTTPISHLLSISGNNTATVTDPSGDDLAFGINSATGTFSGSFLDKSLRPGRTHFHGVLYQKQDIGGGLFLSRYLTGPVSLTPQ